MVAEVDVVVAAAAVVAVVVVCGGQGGHLVGPVAPLELREGGLKPPDLRLHTCHGCMSMRG